MEDAERILHGEEDRNPNKRGCGRRRPERKAHCRLDLRDDATAATLLKDYLASDPKTTQEVLVFARKEHITRRWLYRAKRQLKIKTRAPTYQTKEQGSQAKVPSSLLKNGSFGARVVSGC
jgi:hypothetical protein